MGWSSASTRRMLKVSQSAVSRILFPPTRLAALRRDDDHSSSPVITDGIEQPTRKPQTGRLFPPSLACASDGGALPYLALLRAGFCLPSVLPRTRCALTAPFHPYPPPLAEKSPASYGGQARDGPARRSALARSRAVYFLCH